MLSSSLQGDIGFVIDFRLLFAADKLLPEIVVSKKPSFSIFSLKSWTINADRQIEKTSAHGPTLNWLSLCWCVQQKS